MRDKRVEDERGMGEITLVGKNEGGADATHAFFLVSSHNIRILQLLAGHASVQATTSHRAST